MAIKGTRSVSIKVPSLPKPPKLAEPTIKGPAVAKLSPPSMPKVPTLMSLSVQARRGIAPKLALAKAAAGGTGVSRKRNPDYPTP